MLERLEVPSAAGMERRSPSRRWLVVTVAAAVALTLAVILPTLLPAGNPGSAPKAEAAVSFRPHGSYVLARITNPAADVAEMQKAFASHGFDIEVTLMPVSPSLVGTIPYVSVDDSAQGGNGPTVLTGHGCVTPGGGSACPVGLRIPAGFDGRASITVGRPASPGEDYASAADATAPGEALYCTGIIGKTVEEALPILDARGQTPLWRSSDSAETVGDDTDPSTIADDYVSEVTSASSTEVYAFVSRTPPSASGVPSAPCPKGSR